MDRARDRDQTAHGSRGRMLSKHGSDDASGAARIYGAAVHDIECHPGIFPDTRRASMARYRDCLLLQGTTKCDCCAYHQTCSTRLHAAGPNHGEATARSDGGRWFCLRYDAPLRCFIKQSTGDVENNEEDGSEGDATQQGGRASLGGAHMTCRPR